jgi:hypothetical protein
MFTIEVPEDYQDDRLREIVIRDTSTNRKAAKPMNPAVLVFGLTVLAEE